MKKIKYFLKDENDKYLVKGFINDKPFDGNTKPYQFTRNEAMCLVAQFDYTMEEVHEI